MYFDKVKEDDEIYSLIYGNGVVCFVLDRTFRLPGSYMFKVRYKTAEVYYTEDGVPNWCEVDGDCQTAYYKKDFDRPEMDFETIDKKILSKKKIAKLKELGNLEIRVPSGAWLNVEDVPQALFLKAIRAKDFYLFRKEQ